MKHTLQRYQLNKQSLQTVESAHPWIFRNHLSSAIDPLPNGQWLKLMDGKNSVRGYGILEKTDGLIGIRVLKRGASPPDRDWFLATIKKALEKRTPLRKYTDAFRAIHGENDGLPGVVVDVYAETAVLQTYAPSVDLLGRYVAQILKSLIPIKSIIWKMPAKRKHQDGREPIRVLFGHPNRTVSFMEGKLALTVEPLSGQKSGAFLDLRGLRKWISLQQWNGREVLNLFAYTGTLGLAAEVGGAKSVCNVDISEGALKTAEKFHQKRAGKQTYVTADIFDWMNDPKRKREAGRYGLVIVDPPMMASRNEQVPRAMRKYRELYRATAPLVQKEGFLVAACCTSRIKRDAFKKLVCETLHPDFVVAQTILPESDHPVGFPEGDYLKILVFRRK